MGYRHLCFEFFCGTCQVNAGQSGGAGLLPRIKELRAEPSVPEKEPSTSPHRNDTSGVCGWLSKLWSLFGSPKLGPVLGPVFVKMKNQAGQHVPLIKRAETVAQYLASEHWQNNLQAE